MEKELKKIILSALIDAAFMGYDKDDDYSQEMMEDLADNTTEEILRVINT